MTSLDTARRRWTLRLLLVTASALVALVPPAAAASAAPAPAAAVQPRGDTGSGTAEPDPGADRSDPAQSAAAAERARERARAQEQARERARAQAQERARERARAAATAARRAAQLAEAGQRAHAIWAARGQPRRMVVVRPEAVDLVTDGRLTRRTPRPARDLTLAVLNRYLPRSWLSITDGTARLTAAVVLTPRTTLEVGDEVRTLQLAGGAGLPDAASLYTGGGRLVLRGVTVTSADPTFQQAMPPSPGRPFVVVSTGGRLDATDTTLSDLGTTDAEPEARPGVQFNDGGSGSLVRTAVAHTSAGLRLTGSQDVRLTDVTVSGSGGDGLNLDGDRGTVMSGVRAVGNRGDGVRIRSAGAGHPITGITAADNGRYGIAVIRATGTTVTGVQTSGNASGGLELSQATDVTVTGLTAADEPVGVFTHISSTGITLDRLTITGGRRGVAIEKTTSRLTLQNSAIDDAKVTGVAVGGSDITLDDVAVSGSRTDVRIERGAEGVTAVGLRLSGGRDGLVATPGTTGVVLHNLTAHGIENDAVRSFSPDTRIIGGTIIGATTGLHLAAAAVVSGTSISLVNDGIRARTGAPVHADQVDIDAIAVGIDTGADSPVVLSGSRVHALEAVRGDLVERGVNDLSLPPLNLLGAIGLPLILLAVLLQQVHLVRRRTTGEGEHRWTPPVVATASARGSPRRSAAGPRSVIRRLPRARPRHSPVP